MNNQNFNPKISVNCPICNAKHEVEYDSYQDWELVVCSQDEDQPEYCDAPFVVNFAVENIKEPNRVGKIIETKTHLVGNVKPARRRAETDNGFYEAIYPFQVPEYRAAARAFYNGYRAEYPRLVKVEFVENVTNEVYWAIGTKAAFFFELAPEIPLTEEMTATLIEKGFSLLDNQANVIAYEKKAAGKDYRMRFYADRILAQFRSFSFEPNEKHSYTAHDFTYADFQSAVEWLDNPIAEPRVKLDELDKCILSFIGTATTNIDLDEILGWISLDGRFAMTEASRNVVTLRLNRMVGAGLVTREGELYRLPANPIGGEKITTKQILDNLTSDEPPTPDDFGGEDFPTNGEPFFGVMELFRVMEPASGKTFSPKPPPSVACTNCGLPVMFDSTDKDFPLLKCAGCQKEFTFFQAIPFVPLATHSHECVDCGKTWNHNGTRQECGKLFKMQCSAANLDCAVLGRSLNTPIEDNPNALTNNQQLKFDIICNYIDWFSSDESEREIMKNGALEYVCEDHVDEIGGEQ